MADWQAGCCCGALSITLTGEPVMNGVCHCDNCKRRTGSAFGWQCYFRDEDVGEPQGEVATYAFDAASGHQERRFCPTCGSTVWWRSAAFPKVTGIAAGCLTGADVGPPSLSASDARRCLWLDLPADWMRWA